MRYAEAPHGENAKERLPYDENKLRKALRELADIRNQQGENQP